MDFMLSPPFTWFVVTRVGKKRGQRRKVDSCQDLREDGWKPWESRVIPWMAFFICGLVDVLRPRQMGSGEWERLIQLGSFAAWDGARPAIRMYPNEGWMYYVGLVRRGSTAPLRLSGVRHVRLGAKNLDCCSSRARRLRVAGPGRAITGRGKLHLEPWERAGELPGQARAGGGCRIAPLTSAEDATVLARCKSLPPCFSTPPTSCAWLQFTSNAKTDTRDAFTGHTIAAVDYLLRKFRGQALQTASVAPDTAVERRANMDAVALLDTPKRLSLSSRSADLRVALKDWEKSFASIHAGQKPGKTDIKADPEISKKYKEYSRLRDVLAGKLSLTALNEPKSPTTTKRTRADSAVSFTPRKLRCSQVTHPSQIDPYDPPNSASPKPVFLTAIGPTPQRDGKALGLFDLLSNSGGSSAATPSSRKRKIDALDEKDLPAERLVARTPGRRHEQHGGDLLQHLSEDTFDSASKAKHLRTPASEGKKFMLSHFFATPTALRYAAIVEEKTMDGRVLDRTPLRSMVLGISPAKPNADESPAPDATPAYLKRSFSFKDRLLSASHAPSTKTRSAESLGFASPKAVRTGPRRLQRMKSMPKPLSQMVRDLRQMEDAQLDDDMDALREIEGNIGSQDLVADPNTATPGAGEGNYGSENNVTTIESQRQRVWKKKGQKRTTRRSVMRPALVKPRDAPKWVAADDGDEEDQAEEGENNAEDANVVEETQLATSGPASPSYDDLSEDELAALDELTHEYSPLKKRTRGEPDEEGETYSSDCSSMDKKPKEKARRGGSAKSNKADKMGKKDGKTKADKDKSKSSGIGTINPNAHSHMNFRSLKIRNKNSKAKGGGRFGGRFGRGRR